MPTGSGKTRTAMEIISIYLNENPGKSILWLANSEELFEQAIESFKDVWSHVGNFDVEIIRAWGSYDIIIPEKSSFIVGGFQKFNSQFLETKIAESLSKNIALIVIDEVHQVIAPTYMHVIEQLTETNFHIHLIGLTATPGRGNINNPETYLLIKFFDGNKIEIDSGDDTVFEFLRKENY
jgi:superfamily II DNA or RNA helicase